MKQVLKILGLAVKYASIITVVVEILTYATDKLKPFSEEAKNETLNTK